MVNFHENHRREHERPRSSARSFGLLVTAVFVLIGLWPLLHGLTPRWWALVIAIPFAVLTAILPRSLQRFNALWIGFGLTVHKIMTPLVMGIIFFGAVTPVALLMRLFGKDPLHRRLDPSAQTYWVTRDPPGPERKSMRNQF